MTTRPEHGEIPYIPPQRIGFKNLSANDGQWYEEVAARALELLGVRNYTISGLVRHSNVTAKVNRHRLPPLALRIRTGPTVSALTELTWLSAVRAGTQVHTVEPFKSTLNENTVLVRLSEGAPPSECSLFAWADGDPLAARLGPENYRKLGAMSAELHNFASTWRPPSGLNPLRWDRTLYYEGTRLVLASPEYSSLVSTKDAERVVRVVAESDRELARIAQLETPIFLHGNIEMWNVIVDQEGQLVLLDFEDVMLGQPIQDIAITLYYGMERPDYQELSIAFREGYHSVREWPVTELRTLELLMAARATMLLNHALLTEPDPAPVVERLLPIITRVG
jgi:Ser/Thr protein kinase RdoA (MazF antagonist)